MNIRGILILCAALLSGCKGDCELVSCPNKKGVSFSYCATQTECFFRGGSSKFQCGSCNDCNRAHEAVLDWCAAQPTVANPIEGESCQAGSCGSATRSYQFCAAPDATSCRFVGSDGTQFSCVSCGDCTIAAGKISTWCNGNPTPLPDLGMPPKTIGDECRANTDCRDGTSPSCLKGSGAVTGTCAATCNEDLDCGDKGICVFTSATAGKCARLCESGADCPTGMTCWIALNSSAPVCYPDNQVNIMLNCDPTVANCTVGGAPGGCDRQALGNGNTGECVRRCVAGVNTCPMVAGAAESCYALDKTKDENGMLNGDAMRGTFCGYRQSTVVEGAECLLDGSHYYNICPDGMECDITAFNPAGDNRCHKLCYLGNFTPNDPFLPVGAMVAGPCTNATCTDVFGLAGTTTPVGLCK